MSHILHRLSKRTRWQIYARVLPVMFLAVISIGVISWVVFTHHATGTAEKIQKQEVGSLLDNLRRRASLEAMAVEVRQNDFLARGGRADGAHLVEDLLQMELLDGVALGRPYAAEGETPGVFSLVDSLANEANEATVTAWLQKYSHCFQSGFRSGSWSKVRVSDAPVLVDSNPGHPVYLFPPLLLQAPGESRLALLPVMVRDERREVRAGHPVYFLDLRALVRDFQPSGWWCVLDGEGTVMVSATGSVEAGAKLAGRPRGENGGVFGVAGGAELWNPLRPGEDIRTTVVNARWLPWIVTIGRGPDLPFTLLTAHEVSGLRTMGFRFVMAVLAVALLALSLALYGVTRVVYNVSKHLSHLAISKDEAHRLVQIKAESLRGSLDDLRALDQAKDNFLILISHEVRTPLTSIMGGVDFLKSSVARVRGPERELLDRLNILEIASIIESSGQRLTGFMNDAIQMTTIQSRNLHLDLQAVPVASFVEIGLCGIRERAHLRGITVTNELEERADWAVLCDQKILKVAFEKILNNAVVHNFEGGQIVIREAQKVPGQDVSDCRVDPEGECVLKGQASFGHWEHEEITWRLIEIFNTGDPIPEDRREALFGKFELVGRIEHHQKGSGLSMPIASSAVKNHGGSIMIYADPKLGNSFFLLVPTLRSGAVANPGLNGGPDQLLTDQMAESFGGGAGDKKVGQMADASRFEIEFDDAGASLAGGADQTGGGVDGTGSADHEEEVTIGSGRP
jgi:signal transduction histidine kinase